MTDQLVSLNWTGMSGEIGSLMAGFNALPRHVAKKYLGAAMKRALKIGVPVLKRNTPVGKVLKANKKGVVKLRNSGALRRAATAKSKYVGTNKDGLVVGILGYKYGDQSKKALWLEFGTSRGIKPRRMASRALNECRNDIAAKLCKELAASLEAAATEIRDGRAVGTNYRRKGK